MRFMDMNKRSVVPMCSLLVFLLAACGSMGGNMDLAVPPGKQDMLKNPDKVTLYTVVTYWDLVSDSGLTLDEFNALPTFHGDSEIRVLGEAHLDAADAKTAIDSFVAAVDAGEHAGMACFMPHHALRIEKGGQTLDILVCFMCSNYKVLPDGGNNNVVMSNATGMEATWRNLVTKHSLRDISAKP